MGKRWYQIPETWLILALLASAVFGSFGLIAAALEHPDPVLLDHGGPLPPPHPARTP